MRARGKGGHALCTEYGRYILESACPFSGSFVKVRKNKEKDGGGRHKSHENNKDNNEGDVFFYELSCFVSSAIWAQIELEYEMVRKSSCW